MPISTDVPVCIGPYVTERLVGRGAMAAVYLCRAPGGEPVAVKWMDLCLPGAGPQDGSFTPPLLARFEREVRALSKLNHPNVVRYRGHGLWHGRPYLVMDHVEGSDLRVYTDKLAQRPPAERYARARTIGQSLCEAAGALHAVGLVHRDIKPGNVLVDPDGRVVLSDLGVVKDLQETKQTLVGVVVGTIAYAAPEQLEGGEVDPRTDLYGIGATLYVLLTGHRPFEGQGRLPGQSVPPPSRWDPELPADLEAVVLRLMAPQPSARFPDAQAAAAALARPKGGGGGLTLAGRGKIVRRVTECLNRAESGRGSVIIQVGGPMGVGRSWLAGVVRAAGSRRGLTVVEPGDDAAAKVAVARAAAQPGIVVLTQAPVQVPPGLALCRAILEPLSVADVRRTVVAAAPLTDAPAHQAERLHRWTGGLPALLTPLLQAHTHGARLELPPDPALGPAVDHYLTGLDLDTVEVLGALAALGGPADLHTIEAVARLPPELSLAQLQSRGMVREVDGLYSLTAEQFALAGWARQADPEGLRQRAAVAAGDRPKAAVGPSPEDIALSGHLAKALHAARRGVADAQARGDRGAEGLALCSRGQVQLDVGLFEAARRSLADASALAKASGNTTLGRQAHVMRSRAQLHGLDSRQPRARASAAAALDRVVPLASGADQRRSAQDAQIFAAWA
ncbi:MAG: serine/threonine protein kinase, partial [Oligoflexia bacterium]|nr:serine/threonine protein kinase [Oligoflexia bacterium]